MKPQNLRGNLEGARAREFVLKMSAGSAVRVPHTDYIMLNTSGDPSSSIR